MEIEQTLTITNRNCDAADSKLKLVAVHLGMSDTRAGGERQKELAKRLCESVMSKELEHTSKPHEGDGPSFCANTQCAGGRPSCRPAEDAVVKLIKYMENESSLNCGYGSNLTTSGHVECDASLMSTQTRSWTGVGAVSGCRNPIELAKSLHDHQLAPRPLGLVQPNLLAGTGTKKWMRDHCPHLVVPESRLISAGSLSRYQKFKSAHDAAVRQGIADGPNGKPLGPSSDRMDMSMDTVGAIAVDCDNNFACAISSGGIVLKHQGRIGQACVPGGGCWAQNGTAVTTTGVGELLSRTLLAKMFHERLETQRLLQRLGHLSEVDPIDTMKECFTELTKSIDATNQTFSGRLAGILAVNFSEPCDSSLLASEIGQHGDKFHLTCGHNGRSMCIGYMTRVDSSGHSLLLERADENFASPIFKTIRLGV